MSAVMLRPESLRSVRAVRAVRAVRTIRVRTVLNVFRLVALCGLTGCVGREDGARFAARITHVGATGSESRAEPGPSVRRIEPLQLERARDTAEASSAGALAQIQVGGASLAGSKRDLGLVALLEKSQLSPGARAVSVLPMVVEAQVDGGSFTHFLAETGRDWTTWSNLLAGSRLGTSLGVDAVPETTLRTFDRKELRSRMRPRDARRGLPLWDDQKRAGPSVRGALFAVPIPEQRVRFDRRIAWSFWGEELRQDAPGASTRKLDRDLWERNAKLRALAPQVSSLLVLDHLLGMRDRWGTDVVVVSPKAPRLLALDLEDALDPHAALDLKRKPGVAIKHVERFSRRLVVGLRKLTKDDVFRAIGVDEQGARLLDEQQVGLILARRDALVKHVDALIAKNGEDRVLCWE
jgi:hypothetical protein